MDTYLKELIIRVAKSSQELLWYYEAKTLKSSESTIRILTDDFDGGGGDTMPPKYSDGSFRVRPNGIIEYRFMHLDKRISVYGKTKESCWNKRTETIKGKEPKKKSSLLLYRDWLEKWYNTYKVPYNGKSSLRSIKDYIDDVIIPVLGEIPIKKIEGFQLQELLNKFSETANTQKKIKGVLNGSLEKARQLKLIDFNPCDAIELVPHKAKSYRALELEEQRTIYEAIEDEEMKKLFMFCCCTGIRIGRVVALTANNFDFKRMQITVIKKQKKGLNETYKVDFTKELIKIPQSGKLFPTLNQDKVANYFTSLYEKLKIKNATIHSFRHTFSSNCYHIGIKDKQIQQWMGHSTIAMTMNTYTHLLKNGTSPTLDYLKELKDKLQI